MRRLLALILLLAACSSGGAPQEVRLPSGKQIKILGTGTLYMTQ